MCMVSTCFLSLQFMLIGPFGGGFLWRISGFKEALYAIFMIFCCSFREVFYSGTLSLIGAVIWTVCNL